MQDLLDYCAPFAIDKLQLLSSGLEGSTYIAQSRKTKYILSQLKEPYQQDRVDRYTTIYKYFFENGCPLPSLLSLGKTEKTTLFLTTYALGKTEVHWTKKELAKVGTFLAVFHQLSSRCPYTLATLPYPTQLHNEFEEIRPYLPKEFYELKKAIEPIEEKWPSSLPKGIIHGDIWPKNVLFEEGEISSILHFISPTYELFLLDLAKAAKSFYFAEDREELLLVLLDAYQSIRPLSSLELESLDFMVSAACIGSIVRLLKQGAYYPEKREALYTTALSHFYKWCA